MKHLRFIVLALSLILWNVHYAQSDEDRGFIVEVGQQVQDLSLHMLNGDTMSMSDLEGKVVVLQFTASWCSVCIKEMPHLQSDVWEAHKDQDFLLIGVDIDKDITKVAPFIERMQVTYPIALDSKKELFYKFAAQGAGVTRNIVIDKTGEIAFMTRLFDPVEFELMKDKIASLLE